MSRRPRHAAVAAVAPARHTAALLRTLALALAVTLAGCATVNPYHDPARQHHRPDGFNNLHVDNHRADAPSFWRWQWERLFSEHHSCAECGISLPEIEPRLFRGLGTARVDHDPLKRAQERDPVLHAPAPFFGSAQLRDPVSPDIAD